MRDITDSKTLELPGLEPEYSTALKNRHAMSQKNRNGEAVQQQLELLEATDASGLPPWSRDSNMDLTGLPIWAKDQGFADI
ncbi:hypothetical protein [Undibacterium sp.]|uniref:hypothetical protein n=1 Tax=Undibacterium sp. TaxID=1914977 RepID=UPI00374DE961